MIDVVEIEKRVDRAIAGAVAVSAEVGGIKFVSMMEMMEFAKLMAVSGVAVPPHCRGQPGVCLAIVVQAQELRMSPFAVANQSYMANDRIAYQSQLIHAIVELRAPLKGRLRSEILGEGDQRRCRVWATFRGEDKPHVYESETLAKLRDARGRNDRGQVRGSQMWDHQPEVQLFYSASRTWARMYCPDVILGIYSIDELPNDRDEKAVDKPLNEVGAFAQRLRDAKAARAGDGRGLNVDHVNREASARSTIIEGEVNPDSAKTEEKKDGGERGGGRDQHEAEGRPDDNGDRGAGNHVKAGSAKVRGAGQAVGDDPVRKDAESAAKGEGDTKPKGKK